MFNWRQSKVKHQHAHTTRQCGDLPTGSMNGPIAGQYFFCFAKSDSILLQYLSCSTVPSSFFLPLRAFLGASAYGRSLGGGGCISRFGRPCTSVSERRIVGTDVDARRAAADFLAGGGDGAGAGGGGGGGSLLTKGLGGCGTIDKLN